MSFRPFSWYLYFTPFHSFSQHSAPWNLESNNQQPQTPELHMVVTVAPLALPQPDMVTVLVVRNGFSGF
jgi:hypothetical protein